MNAFIVKFLKLKNQIQQLQGKKLSKVHRTIGGFTHLFSIQSPQFFSPAVSSLHSIFSTLLDAELPIQLFAENNTPTNSQKSPKLRLTWSVLFMYSI